MVSTHEPARPSYGCCHGTTGDAKTFSLPYSSLILTAAASVPFFSLVTLNSQIARSLGWIFCVIDEGVLAPVSAVSRTWYSVLDYACRTGCNSGFADSICFTCCATLENNESCTTTPKSVNLVHENAC